MLNIKACIFDLDGVIVDTAGYHFKAWRRLANELGTDFTKEDNEKLKGVSRRGSLDLILKWGNLTIPEEEKTALTDRKNSWYVEQINKMTAEEILPGVKRFLANLRERGIKIGLGSASRNAPRIIQRVGLEEYFDSMIDGGMVSKGKPNPETFLKAAAELGVLPGNTIVFEDAEKGVTAALDGGMLAVGVGKEEILGHAHYVVPGFENLEYDVLLEILQERMLPIQN